MRKTQPAKKITVLGTYLNALRQYPYRATLTMLTNIGAFSLYALIPWLYKNLFDALSAPVPKIDAATTAISVIVLLAIVHGIRLALRFASEMLLCSLEPRFMKDLVVSAFKYTIGQSYEFFTNAFAGSLVRKINRFGNAVETIHDIVHFNVTGIVITTIGSLALIGLRSAQLFWVFVGWIIITIFINIVFSKRVRKMRQDRSIKDSENSGVLSDAISNSVNVRLFQGHAFETGILNTVAEELRILRAKTWYRQTYLIYSQTFLLTVVEVVAIWWCVNAWSKGSATIGDLVLIQTVIVRLNEMVWSLNNIFRQFYENVADAQEMVDILNTPYAVKDVKNAKDLKTTDGKIIFDNIKFNYGEKNEIFSNLSLVINGHEKIALVGPSGAGKSTIIRLLFRQYNSTDGKILIDGQDISKTTQESLCNALSMVPQDPVLFHRSLMDNIRYGRRDATDAEVIAAAKKAHCHEFINKLPDGYKTFVGERGIKLSGGERQRVAIARAILKNAPILVLDEATSSLDSESEHLIHEALHELMKDKTVIVIAHRLSTIMEMDRIIVVEDGQVADAGTHEELLKHEGTYKKLWDIQAGGFIA